MKRITLLLIGCLFAGSLRADDTGALLDLLVRKKLITEKDAQGVRAELATDKSSSDAAKIKLSAPVTELELYGDARLRYDLRQGETSSHDTQQRERERYRLRLGLRGTLADDWFFGVRLETSPSARSSNVTFGDDTSNSSAGGGGPFAKGSDGVNVGQAYLGYKGFPDLILTAGKMPNPLITTLMVWDADINPEGLAEQWKHTFTVALGGGEAESDDASYTKDGMAKSGPKSTGAKLKIDLFANFAQFVYDDANPENPLGARGTNTQPGARGSQLVPNTDAFLLAWQIGARFTLPNGIWAQVAPTLYNYTGNGDTFNIHYQGGDRNLSNTASLTQNQTGINSLFVFDLPGEIDWKLGKIPMRFFADFAVNLEGDERAAAAGHPSEGDQRYAYQVGLAVGQLKKKSDWQIAAFWQRQDQFALDPNLVDTEFFDSKLNLEGIGLTIGYMLSDAVSVNFLYTYARRAESGLGTGGLGDISINPVNNFQLFQADLNWKW
jgi:Putative porin